MNTPFGPNQPTVIVEDRPHAPIVYFEVAAARAHVNGLCGITLCAFLQLPERDGVGVKSDLVVTGYLRTNLQGMVQLRNLIDQMLLGAAPMETGSQN